MTKLTVFDKIEKVLTRFRDQISELDSKLFKILVGIMETLRETFKENARVFSEGIQDDNHYIWKILKVTEVKEQFDPIIRDMDVKKVLYDMMQNIFSKVDKWTEKQDDNELSRMISGFILDEFKDATQKTMTDYLYIKYNASTLQQLSDSIEQDIMQDKLWNRSAPMFWKTP